MSLLCSIKKGKSKEQRGHDSGATSDGTIIMPLNVSGHWTHLTLQIQQGGN